ncbi:TIGR04197 family type VII secretion effector [Butyrivibrio sp. M55]|uniref:TIGR04197 family type VII secretion effector n=1 Tax=Butyrivibrio sp. M55 TaxID=1855323 RepID=UPI0008F0A522|nr:TIGR04197 family type VII secretion effector [Butyrivibrio sp. M55]SFU91673.1 type VII secretion effector, SACOL2603 family [Butyrivibrio sp. M55]
MAEGMEIKVNSDEIDGFRKRLLIAGIYLGGEIDEDSKDHKSNIAANINAHASFVAEKDLRKSTQKSVDEESNNIAIMKKNYEDNDQQASNYITVDLTANIPNYDKNNSKNSKVIDEAELQELYDEIMADEVKKEATEKAKEEFFNKLNELKELFNGN